VIDLHCHILPGLDDGPANMDFSVAMAREAVADGTQIIVATPHVRSDYVVEPAAIEPAVDELNRRLKAEGVMLRVMAGAEIGWREVADIDDGTLATLCLGSSGFVLIECPYSKSAADLEGVVHGVRERGFQVVLAHPERCPLFQADPDRLAALVGDGVLASVTASSVAGGFGERVQQAAFDMLERGLVHDIASDAHDHLHRRPTIAAIADDAAAELPALAEHLPWYTVTAPVAILRGEAPDDVPRVARPRASAWRRIRRRA
jgi:protein-tyrosine phosphatase